MKSLAVQAPRARRSAPGRCGVALALLLSSVLAASSALGQEDLAGEARGDCPPDLAEIQLANNALDPTDPDWVPVVYRTLNTTLGPVNIALFPQVPNVQAPTNPQTGQADGPPFFESATVARFLALERAGELVGATFTTTTLAAAIGGGFINFEVIAGELHFRDDEFRLLDNRLPGGTLSQGCFHYRRGSISSNGEVFGLFWTITPIPIVDSSEPGFPVLVNWNAQFAGNQDWNDAGLGTPFTRRKHFPVFGQVLNEDWEIPADDEPHAFLDALASAWPVDGRVDHDSPHRGRLARMPINADSQLDIEGPSARCFPLSDLGVIFNFYWFDFVGHDNIQAFQNVVITSPGLLYDITCLDEAIAAEASDDNDLSTPDTFMCPSLQPVEEGEPALPNRVYHITSGARCKLGAIADDFNLGLLYENGELSEPPPLSCFRQGVAGWPPLATDLPCSALAVRERLLENRQAESAPKVDERLFRIYSSVPEPGTTSAGLAALLALAALRARRRS